MTRPRLPAWSLFAALIAMAGLPIYIHAPKFYVDSYGLSLAALGGVLALLRLIDVVQDPLLGWLAQATRRHRPATVAAATLLMAASLWALFAAVPPIAPLWWFALTLTALFSAFSFLTIAFYAEGVSKAATLGPQGHIRLAGWREAGALCGVCLAAVAPVAFAPLTSAPFTAFAATFAALALVATLAMHREWSTAPANPGALTAPAAPGTLPTTEFPNTPAPSSNATAPVALSTPTTPNALANPLALFRPALSDPLARRLLLIALLNAAPVAVTSTTFLFFVESRLAAPGAEGPLLLLFFLSAAAAAPLWTRAAARFGAKPTLMAGMTLSIAAFLWAATLTAGDTLAFAAICAASGAALGADLTLLPALFARRLAHLGTGTESAAFGLWSFVSKLSLALAAATLLPALQAAGFTPGAVNPPSALLALSLIYAALPCVLKLIALALLARTQVMET